MLDNINFIDLTALLRITPDATVERFGGLINSSFFDASNILGSLKQKGLVDFVTQFPSQSAISVTEEGKKLISEAQEKTGMPFDELDYTIIVQMSKGNRTLPDITNNVNVTSKDLAMHLHKLAIQQFISFELRNGNMNINLTEKGFLRVKEGVPQQAQPAMQQQAAPPEMAAATQAVPPAPGAPANPSHSGMGMEMPKSMDELMALEQKIMTDQKTRSMALLVVIVIFVVIIAILYLLHAI